VTTVNFATPKVRGEHELLFNKPASVRQQEIVVSVTTGNIMVQHAVPEQIAKPKTYSWHDHLSLNIDDTHGPNLSRDL